MYAAASSLGYGSRVAVSAETFCNVRMSALKAYYKEKYYYKVTKGMRLEMGMEGYRKSYSTTTPPRLPFGPDLLRVLGTELLAEGSAQSLIQWGCALLGFLSLCRSGEMWGPIKKNSDEDHLVKWKNVTYGYGSHRQRKANRKTKWVEIYFESSKGDRYKKGCRIRLGKIKDKMVCPVRAIRWIQKGRKHLKLRDTPDSRVSQIGTGVVIHRQQVINRIKKIAKKNGLDPKLLSGHSLRIGGATQLMAAGFDATVIKLMGRWKSDCYMAYLRLNPNLAGIVAMNILHV